MADLSVLSRLVSGYQRNVDISSNTLVTLSIKVGGGITNTELTKTILDNLIAHMASTSNPHSVTKTQVGLGNVDNVQQLPMSYLDLDDTLAANSDLKVPSQNAIKTYVDTAVGAATGSQVKVSANDTTSAYLDGSLTAGNGLSKSITNPSGNEVLDLAVNVDNSSIEIATDALQVKDGGITNAKVAAGIDAAKIADGTVSNAEFQYIGGLTSDAQTQLNAKVAKAGSSMDSAANLTFSGGGEVLGLPATPSVAGAAASKAYVDAVALGLKPKQAVRVASLANVAIATGLENGDALDGITLATGDRVLLKDQSAPEENGIYIVAATGAASRSSDMDSLTPIDEINGSWVPVQEGTQAGRVYVQYGIVVTLGTTAINFEFYNPLAALVGGDMISVSGSNISVDVAAAGGLESSNPGNAAGQIQVKIDGSSLSKSASGLKVASGGISNTEVNASAGIVESKLALDFSTSSLNTAIGTKVTANGAITGATKTKITYDAKGLVTAGADATTADIADSTNKRYVTDADLVDIGNLSGVNSGDQTITLTGDVTGSGTGSFAATVNNAPKLQTSEVAGEALSANTLYALRFAKAADAGFVAGRLYKSDVDTTSADNFHVIGLCRPSGAIAAGDAITVVEMGIINAPTHGFVIGAPIFLSSAGALTNTAPTTSLHAVVQIGFAKDANNIFVKSEFIGIN